MRRRWIVGGVVVAIVLVGAAIPLVAADRGGPTPDERFAESYCATSAPWVEEMIDIYDDAIHARAAPGHDAGWLPLYGMAYRGQEVARKYGAAIRALRVPDTDAGKKVAKHLDWWSRQPLQTMTEEERRVRKLQGNITLLQSIRGLGNMELQLATAILDMSSPLLPLVLELVEPVQAADSCEELRARIADL